MATLKKASFAGVIRHVLSKIINSNKNLTLTFGLIIVSSAISYSISEKTTLLDALWWSIVTATTVGYGDSFPHNMLGKNYGNLIDVNNGSACYSGYYRADGVWINS